MVLQHQSYVMVTCHIYTSYIMLPILNEKILVVVLTHFQYFHVLDVDDVMDITVQ